MSTGDLDVDDDARGQEEGLEDLLGGDAEPLDTSGQLYPNVYVFVSDYLVFVYARPVANTGPVRWCAKWWEHPEAVSRLETLWMAFEALRATEGTSPADWWRDYADPAMTALMSAEGPFRSCGPTRHDPPPRLPLDELPRGLLEA
ncbi:DUF4913 domain-containing protein [Nocardioides lijunqiniae]|uniref:DUF4913 domain-containing protein n=1 Tax=Nocardioides lijunqiniae TaxID=2760832 RepID=UPI001877BEDC|nr:DUF4913 domain-containing protein [Nocardioides lijunqiniae]